MVFCIESFVYTIYLYWMYLFIYSYSLHHFNSQRCLPLCVLFTCFFFCILSVSFSFDFLFYSFLCFSFIFFSQQAFTSHMRFTFMYFIQIIASWTANILIYQTEYITYIYLYMLCIGSNILERWNRFVISFFVEFHSFYFICAL